MAIMFSAFSDRLDFSEEESRTFERAFDRHVVKKGTTLLKAMQTCDKLYFLQSGTVRTYYDHAGKDVTSWFYTEGQFFTAWYSFLSRDASHEYIETLEDCDLYLISYNSYQELLQSDPLFERFGRLLAEEQTAFIDYFFKGYLYMTAKEKYQLLTTTFPGIELRTKLSHIASFLGITQETLSRIRAQK